MKKSTNTTYNRMHLPATLPGSPIIPFPLTIHADRARGKPWVEIFYNKIDRPTNNRFPGRNTEHAYLLMAQSMQTALHRPPPAENYRILPENTTWLASKRWKEAHGQPDHAWVEKKNEPRKKKLVAALLAALPGVWRRRSCVYSVVPGHCDDGVSDGAVEGLSSEGVGPFEQDA